MIVTFYEFDFFFSFPNIEVVCMIGIFLSESDNESDSESDESLVEPTVANSTNRGCYHLFAVQVHKDAYIIPVAFAQGYLIYPKLFHLSA